MALSDLQDLGILIGLTSLGIGIITLGIGLYFMLKSRKKGSFDLPHFLTGLGIVGLGAPWLGGTAQFLAIILTGEALPYKTQVYISIWGPPIAGWAWIHIVFSLIKKEWRKYALSAITLLNLIFIIFTYILLPFTKTTEEIENGSKYITAEGIVKFSVPEDTGLPDTRFIGIPGICVILYILIFLVVVGGVFLWVSVKTSSMNTRWKARLIGVGCSSYGIFAPVDATFSSNPIIIVVIRILLVCSFLLITIGYTLPNWFRSKIGIPQP